MTENADLLARAHELSLRYLSEIHDRHVMPTAEALSALAELREPLPEFPLDALEVLKRLDHFGSPATVATTGGRFFGFVVGGALPVTIAASWLASTWDQNAGNWILSPIAAELEDIAASWMLDILDLPRKASVGFVTGSTMGAFCSFAAARSALLKRQGYDVKKLGLNGAPRIRIVTSEELHPTNVAALSYAGFGECDIERCATDDQGRIIPEMMPVLDELTLVVLQAGNINSGACDPFRTICSLAAHKGSWVHVDGAFGLWARASGSTRSLTDGIELADSWSVDGHKWLNLPQDSAIYISKDSEAVQDVFGVSATYLVKNDKRQPNTFTPELSRRARGVEFWTALKSLGRLGVEQMIDRCCSHAKRFARNLSACGYEVLNDVVLNQVVFACEQESDTRHVLAKIQESGVVWLGPTTWKGRFAMRLSVSSWATTDEDVDASLAVMREASRDVRAV